LDDTGLFVGSSDGASDTIGSPSAPPPVLNVGLLVEVGLLETGDCVEVNGGVRTTDTGALRNGVGSDDGMRLRLPALAGASIGASPFWSELSGASIGASSGASAGGAAGPPLDP
jgi:hypothetical protein